MSSQPMCDCHGEPMYWNKDLKRKAGGRWYCAIANRERVRKWQTENRDKVLAKNREFRDWLTGIKGTTCSECGGIFESNQLHFHHVDPATKLFEIGEATNRKREKVLMEIEKCVVVCISCHSKIEPRFAGMRGNWIQVGK